MSFLSPFHFVGKEVGSTVLFFGCRKKSEDFIYEDELNSYAEDGTLKDLHVAFSRDQVSDIRLWRNLWYTDDNYVIAHIVKEAGAQASVSLHGSHSIFTPLDRINARSYSSIAGQHLLST